MAEDRAGRLRENLLEEKPGRAQSPDECPSPGPGFDTRTRQSKNKRPGVESSDTSPLHRAPDTTDTSGSRSDTNTEPRTHRSTEPPTPPSPGHIAPPSPRHHRAPGHITPPSTDTSPHRAPDTTDTTEPPTHRPPGHITAPPRGEAATLTPVRGGGNHSSAASTSTVSSPDSSAASRAAASEANRLLLLVVVVVVGVHGPRSSRPRSVPGCPPRRHRYTVGYHARPSLNQVHHARDASPHSDQNTHTRCCCCCCCCSSSSSSSSGVRVGGAEREEEEEEEEELHRTIIGLHGNPKRTFPPRSGAKLQTKLMELVPAGAHVGRLPHGEAQESSHWRREGR
ncbi:LOW QUALITY PROTEIN: hypothetical protein CRUP_035008, partial [Coryphaenoides rupestris]